MELIELHWYWFRSETPSQSRRLEIVPKSLFKTKEQQILVVRVDVEIKYSVLHVSFWFM